VAESRRARVLGVCIVIAVVSTGCTYTARVSVPDGSSGQGNTNVGTNGPPAISADGRFIAFESRATNLVPGDTNGRVDIFLRDPVAQTTRRINTSSAGQAMDADSTRPAISANGRYIAYLSSARNIIPGDAGGTLHAYRYDTSTGTTARVDVNATGAPSVTNGTPAISSDGRYVAFTSTFNGWSANDTAGEDVFVRDMNAQTVTKVSVGDPSSTNPYNTSANQPSISADGRYIAFNSATSSIVPGDTNGRFDVFVRDTFANTTSRVSVTSTGQQQTGGGGGSSAPRISAAGRYVVFQSLATNLYANDINGTWDVFVRDRTAGTTTRVNVSSAGVGANSNSLDLQATISSDGRYVAFDSNADNLVPSDTNQSSDVFVRDLTRSTTTRVSVEQFGTQAAGGFSRSPAISSDGRYIAFLSIANNLVGGDTNAQWDVFVRSNPVPSVSQVAPATVGRGTTTVVSVTGTNFVTTVDAIAPNGITINSIARISETRVDVSITVAANLATGEQQIGLFNPGTGQGAATGSIVAVPLRIT
jgi:Tol biopolymer transport system component